MQISYFCENRNMKSFNPFTNQQIANYPEISTADIQQKLIASQKSFNSWKKTTFTERAYLLLRLAEILLEDMKNKEPVVTVEAGTQVLIYFQEAINEI